MKKVSKIFIALLLVIVAVFGVAGCRDDTQSKLQGMIDELQSQVEDLQSQLDELQQTMEEQVSENEDLQSQIDKLQQAIKEGDSKNEDLQNQIDALQQALEEGTVERDDLQKQIDELRWELAQLKGEEAVLLEQFKEQLKKLEKTGEYPTITTKYTYTLDEAYENGFITREDVMHFCYYSYGIVREGEKNSRDSEWVTVDFTPTEEQGVLSKDRETLIRYAYFMENLDQFYYFGIFLSHPEGYYIKNYFESSNGYYIVQLTPDGGGASVSALYYCAGIAWGLPMPERFCVFKYE